MKKTKSFTTEYRRIIAAFIMTVAAVTLFVSYGFGTQAAEPRDAIFDPTFYAATYPDVAAVYGNDPVGLWKHFTTCGMFVYHVLKDNSRTHNNLPIQPAYL